MIGNLVLDDIITSTGDVRHGTPGGAVVYAALGAALWGVSVGVVAAAGTNYPVDVLASLARRGVDLGGVRKVDEPGLHVRIAHGVTTRHITHMAGSPSFAAWTPACEDLPPDWAHAGIVHLTPMPLDRQEAFVARLAAGPARASVDPHTAVTLGTKARWVRLLTRVDYAFMNEGQDDVALAEWPGPRLRLVLVKAGARGGRVRRADGPSVRWDPVDVAVVDPTGAGDAFAGGFLAGVLRGADETTSLQYALVSASFALAGWGASALLAATPEDAERRRRDVFETPGRT